MAGRNINDLTSQYTIQVPLLSNLNRQDLNNARSAGIRLPDLTPHLERTNLGAHCDELVPHLNPQTGLNTWTPCPIGPLDLVPMRLCDKPPPTGHGAKNVCSNCHRDAKLDRTPLLRENLRRRLTIQCKRCSQRERRLHPAAYQACDCEAHVEAGWKCRRCYEDVIHLRRAGGAWRSEYFLHCHKVTDRRSKTKRKKLVHGGPPRTREACPTQGCGGTPWTLPAFHRVTPEPVSHPRATFMCLNCEGVMVYPVGDPTRK